MKLHHFFFLFSSLLIAACSQSETATVSKGEAELNFNVLNYEQVSLDSLTRATEVSALNHLAMGIYDAATMQLVQQATIQDKADEGYGQFSARLSYGKYHIVFLGYDTNRTIHMEAPKRIYWDNHTVTNTFHHCLTLDVNEETASAHSIVLKRVVGRFSLRVQGNVPETLSQFRVQMQNGFYSLDATTGLGNSGDERDYTFTGHNKHSADETFDIDFYAFLPQESCTATITVQAQDADGNTLRERTFADVPMKQNQLTRYTGDFFAPDGVNSQFSLMLETDVWDEKDFEF